MICEICNENEVAWTLIPIGEGLPQSLCDSCLAIRGIVWSKENLPAEDIAAMLGPMFVTPAREDLHEEAPKVAKRGRKSKAAEPETVEGEAGGEVEAPPAAANE